MIALRGFVDQSREVVLHAALGALEVDSVWAENEADGPESEGVVHWDRLAAHHRQQVRDVDALTEVVEGNEGLVFREMYMRVGSEALTYVNVMRDLFSNVSR